MKSGWKLKTLGEVCKVVSGTGFPKQYQGQSEGDFPFFKVGDMNSDGNEVNLTVANNYISDAIRQELGAKALPQNTIVFPKIGGAISTNKKRRISVPSCVDNNVMGLVPKSPIIDPDYLFAWMISIDIYEFSNKAALPSIKKTTVEDWPIPLPPLDEQKRIVSILDQAFEGLDRARANAEANLLNISDLFEATASALLNQNSEVQMIGALKDVVGNVNTGPFGSLLHKADYVENEIPLINPANIVEGSIKPDLRKTVKAEALRRLHSYKLKEGDIIIGRRGEMGRCAVVKASEDGWLCGTGCFFIRCNSSVNPNYVAQLLRSPAYVSKLHDISKGATMDNLSNKSLSSLGVELPDLDTQNAKIILIDELRRVTNGATEVFQAKLTDIADLRQSILQKAFSGELT